MGPGRRPVPVGPGRCSADSAAVGSGGTGAPGRGPETPS